MTTKDKRAAQEAIAALQSVETMLPPEHKARYKRAITTVARYNGELRRTKPKETVVVATDHTETNRLTQENRDLANRIKQLEHQLEVERHRPPDRDQVVDYLKGCEDVAEQMTWLSLCLVCAVAHWKKGGMMLDRFEKKDVHRVAANAVFDLLATDERNREGVDQVRAISDEHFEKLGNAVVFCKE